ncbi:DUF6438 domain-containing protein [Chryseolinea sp. T2]|uniref:DUF6438 domain-containing protein n=1 Tax=Chryseolinea sp. T2 TaxID=3129255 RepID=UPI003FCC7514
MTLRLIILGLSILIFDGCRRYEKVKLDKIIFHTSRCFGSCPAYHSQIDSNRTLLLHSEYVDNTPDINTDLNNPDTSRIGYFTGQVSDRQYKELVNELEDIGLDDLQFDGMDCCDASTKTIIVYYNGKRKFLKSMFPPREADKLISLLRSICESTNTQRTDKMFQIEDKE